MSNTASNVFIPYEDFVNLQQDSANLVSIVSILNTKFPDDTCQIIAIKSILGIPVDPITP